MITLSIYGLLKSFLKFYLVFFIMFILNKLEASKNNTAYKKPLLKISEYLVGDSKKAEYVLNCFFNQEVLLAQCP